MSNSKKLLSIIVPVFNEEHNIEKFYKAVMQVMESQGYAYEFIFVDDSSNDRSFEILRQIHKQNSSVKAISFSKNFGSHVAISAGLKIAKGDAAVIIACDLQDPPELIESFVKKWQEGFDIVWAKREARNDPFFKKMFANMFYFLLKRLALPNYPKGGTGSFCLIDRKVIDIFLQFKEKSRAAYAIISWSGFRQTEVSYGRRERFSGKSKWTFRKLFKSAIDTLTAYSYFPIRLISYFGIIVSFISLILTMSILIKKIFYGSSMLGWPSIMTAILFLGGVQLIMLGILGEYIWRISEDVKDRPLYIIEESIGL